MKCKSCHGWAGRPWIFLIATWSHMEPEKEDIGNFEDEEFDLFADFPGEDLDLSWFYEALID